MELFLKLITFPHRSKYWLSALCVLKHPHVTDLLDSEMIRGWVIVLPLRVVSSSPIVERSHRQDAAGPWPLSATKPLLWPPEVSTESKLKVISNPYLQKNYLSHVLPQGLYKELI